MFLQRLLPCAHPLAHNPFRTGQFFTFALLPSRTLGSANKNFGWGWQRAATPAPQLLAGWDWHLCTGLSPVRDSLKTELCAAGKGKNIPVPALRTASSACGCAPGDFCSQVANFLVTDIFKANTSAGPRSCRLQALTAGFPGETGGDGGVLTVKLCQGWLG